MIHYIHVFLESLWVASIIPLGGEQTFYGMVYFGGYNLWPAAILAVIGATLGQMFNWQVGHLFLKAHEKNKNFHVSEYWYNRIARLFNKYGIFLLLFSWAPLCKVLLVAAGFLNVRSKFVLPLVIIGQMFNYGRYLL